MLTKNDFALYPILKDRYYKESGLNVIPTYTGSGKSTTLAYLFLDEVNDDKGKFNVYVVENNATLKQTYDKHREIFIENGEDFDTESLFLRSNKEHIMYLLENKELHPYILNFFNDMDNFNSSMKDDYPNSYDILKEVKDMSKFKNIFIRDEKIIDKKSFETEYEEDSKYGRSNLTVDVYTDFQKNITQSIRMYLRKNKKLKYVLMEDIVDAEDFYWLRLFYPQVRLLSFYVNSSFKIKRLYLTFHKSISPLSLVFPISNISTTLDYDFINTANIFIDEADQSYDIILDLSLIHI